MKSIVAVLLVALVAEVNSIVAGVRNVEVSDSVNSPFLQSLRDKRSVGVTRDTKKEWELKTKNGGSLRVSKSISYNDGGALTMLPAVQDGATNNRIKILNQLQNGHGRPEIAQQMLSGASSGIDGTFGGDFGTDTGIESRQTHASTNEAGRFGDWEIVFRGANKTKNTVPPSASVHNITVNASSTDDHNITVNAPSTVVNNTVPPVQPVVTAPINPSPIGIVQTGHSHSHLQKHLQRSIDYHRQKQAQRQALLDRLTARQQQQTAVVAVLQAPYVYTPDRAQVAAGVPAQQSRREALRELIAYKQKIRAQKFHEMLAAIHARKAEINARLAAAY